MRKCGVECTASRDAEQVLKLNQELQENILNAFTCAYELMGRLHELPADNHTSLGNMIMSLGCFQKTSPIDPNWISFNGLVIHRDDIVIGLKNIQGRKFKEEDLYKKHATPWSRPVESEYEYANINTDFLSNNVGKVEIYKQGVLMLTFDIEKSRNRAELIIALLELAREI